MSAGPVSRHTAQAFNKIISLSFCVRRVKMGSMHSPIGSFFKDHIMPNRRDFLKTSAAAGVASAAMTMKASSYDNVAGANERINIAFLGVGGRCQQHIDIINNLVRQNRGVRPVAVCDVWDGDNTLSN